MALSFGFLSTYPSTVCGLATFTRSLATHLAGAGHRTGVVRVLDRPEPPSPAGVVPVVGRIIADAPGGPAEAAAALNEFDVAIIQHEYGIYGGADGEDVVDVIRLLMVPAIVVAHTVLTHPTRHQRAVFEQVLGAASMIVTMSATARQRLLDAHDIDPRRVVVVPHGAAEPTAGLPSTLPSDHPVMLTWGLIGPGKGIESAIDAVALLQAPERPLHYHIVGQTHPKVLARDGELYRHRLMARAIQRRVAGRVSFHGTYLEADALGRMIAMADVVVLPYESREQVTSGVLIEAVAAGKPVVATAFPHAVELLATGAGIVVPHDDPTALAAAIRRVLTEPGLAATMSGQAHTLAPDLAWPAVAARYQRLAAQAAADWLPLPLAV